MIQYNDLKVIHVVLLPSMQGQHVISTTGRYTMAGTVTCLGRPVCPKKNRVKNSSIKYMMKDVYKYMLILSYYHSTRIFIKTRNKYVYNVISVIEIKISKYYPLAWE